MAKFLKIDYIMREDMIDKSIYGFKTFFNVCFHRKDEEVHVLLTRSGRHIERYDFSTPNHPNDIIESDKVSDEELADCREALDAFLTLCKYGLAYNSGIERED
jgi:hypothetical protein